MVSYVTFAQRVRLCRKAHDFTQKELGEIVGVTESRVRKWESGRSFAGAEKLGVLSVTLNVTTDYLLGLTDDPQPTKERLLSEYSSDELMKELIRRWNG